MNLSKRNCTSYFTHYTSQKGITLIALVITIIIMLILASVTINMVFGDEGILTQAQNAGEENRAAAVREQISIWKSTRNWKTKYGIETVDESLEEFTQDLVDKELITETEKNSIITNGQIQIGKGEPLIFGETTPTPSATSTAEPTPTVNLITFSIVDESGRTLIELNAEEGMTWLDWIESDYNTCRATYAVYNNVGLISFKEINQGEQSGGFVKSDSDLDGNVDVIENGNEYIALS